MEMSRGLRECFVTMPKFPKSDHRSECSVYIYVCVCVCACVL